MLEAAGMLARIVLLVRNLDRPGVVVPSQFGAFEVQVAPLGGGLGETVVGVGFGQRAAWLVAVVQAHDDAIPLADPFPQPVAHLLARSEILWVCAARFGEEHPSLLVLAVVEAANGVFGVGIVAQGDGVDAEDVRREGLRQHRGGGGLARVLRVGRTDEPRGDVAFVVRGRAHANPLPLLRDLAPGGVGVFQRFQHRFVGHPPDLRRIHVAALAYSETELRTLDDDVLRRLVHHGLRDDGAAGGRFELHVPGGDVPLRAVGRLDVQPLALLPHLAARLRLRFQHFELRPIGHFGADGVVHRGAAAQLERRIAAGDGDEEHGRRCRRRSCARWELKIPGRDVALFPVWRAHPQPLPVLPDLAARGRLVFQCADGRVVRNLHDQGRVGVGRSAQVEIADFCAIHHYLHRRLRGRHRFDRRFPTAELFQIRQRIDDPHRIARGRCAAALQAEVQMRAERVPGVAGQANEVSFLHQLATCHHHM